jgi:hypothetical protein
MDVEIRVISEGELDAFFRASEAASSSVPSDDELERKRTMAEPDGCFAAFDGPEILGTAARRFSSDGHLRLEISDPFCPWNEGRYARSRSPAGT